MGHIGRRSGKLEPANPSRSIQDGSGGTMQAKKATVIFGLAVVLAAATGLTLWITGSRNPNVGVETAANALHPRPSEELAPFDWHDEPVDLPALTFATADGTTLTMADFQGQMVLINLWATWCAPCLREMPMLDTLAAEAEGPGLTVIALNQDRAGLEAALPYWEDKAFTALDLYLDDGLATGRALKPTGLPLTVLIDKDGREIARLAGIAEWDDPAVIAYFKAVAEGGS